MPQYLNSHVTIDGHRRYKHSVKQTKYTIFYNQYRDRVFSYVIRMTGDFYLSNDIMQESFTRYLAKYGPDTENSALLFTIARNAVLDEFRKQKRVTEQENKDEKSVMDPEKLMLIREEYQTVIEALQKLSPEDRDLLSLVAGGEFSYKDIAGIVGISEGNVKVRVHRARVKLKSILQQGGYP